MAKTTAKALESAIENALNLGYFIDYDHNWDFVKGLEQVRDRIVKQIDTQPQQAVELFELFIAGCYEKIEEIDDSSGGLGTFAEDLFCDWVKARQAAAADPTETAEALLAWMDNDDYGFCYRLEKRIVKTFDEAGLAAFEKTVRARFDAIDATAPRGEGFKDDPAYQKRQAADILRAIYLEQRNVDAYRGVCDEMGLTPKDCEAIAELYQRRRKPEEALAWVERGLELERDKRWGSMGSSYRLPELKRTLLNKVGRAGDALDSAWSDFQQAPSEYSYADLMKYVPKAEKAEWHRKAMAVAETDMLASYIGLCVKTKEWEPLVARLRRTSSEELEELGHYTTEPAAKKLVKTHPDVAAKLYQALGVRILASKKSKYYDEALDHFEQAKKCYAQAGLEAQWDSLVDEVRRQHGRKYSFMPGFERLVAGEKPKPAEPAFLERARRRWQQR